MYKIETIRQVLQQYFANNALLPVAFIAVLYWTKGSKNKKRYLFCVIVMLALLLNDWVFRFIIKIGEVNTYYRILWIIPLTLFVAYLVIEILSELSDWKRIGMTVLMTVFFWIYAVPSWTSWGNLPSNIYQLDDEVIQVADVIAYHSKGERVTIICDDTIGLHIREYNDNLCHPGGENQILYSIMEEKKLDLTKEEVEEAALLARADYIILPKSHKGANALLVKAEFEFVGSSDSYNIYYVNRPVLGEKFKEKREEQQ